MFPETNDLGKRNSVRISGFPRSNLTKVKIYLPMVRMAFLSALLFCLSIWRRAVVKHSRHWLLQFGTLEGLRFRACLYSKPMATHCVLLGRVRLLARQSICRQFQCLRQIIFQPEIWAQLLKICTLRFSFDSRVWNICFEVECENRRHQQHLAPKAATVQITSADENVHERVVGHGSDILFPLVLFLT